MPIGLCHRRPERSLEGSAFIRTRYGCDMLLKCELRWLDPRSLNKDKAFVCKLPKAPDLRSLESLISSTAPGDWTTG